MYQKNMKELLRMEPIAWAPSKDPGWDLVGYLQNEGKGVQPYFKVRKDAAWIQGQIEGPFETTEQSRYFCERTYLSSIIATFQEFMEPDIDKLEPFAQEWVDKQFPNKGFINRANKKSMLIVFTGKVLEKIKEGWVK